MSRDGFRFGAGILVVLMILVPALVFAQSELKISRPLDGATVRETVNILVPVSSVPADGFITVTIDDAFRGAQATKSEDGQYFVCRWNTKAEHTDPNVPPEARKPRDGKHTILVEAYDSTGKKVGEGKKITVYVKNNASADMPAEGLKLRYNHKMGTVNRYKFDYTLNLKSIQGGTTLAAQAGKAIEGARGIIKRTIEDIMSDNTALVRQKLEGVLEGYQSGRTYPMTDLQTRSLYHVEDSTGHITYTMKSASPGAPVGIDLPNLPAQRIRIGDSWTQADKVFRNVITGDAVTMMVTSTLEGLEWHGGHPCAKITSTFSGIMKIPFSRIFTEPVMVTDGKTTTYFAYKIGKVISTNTTAIVKAKVDPSVVNNLTSSLAPQGMSPGGMSPISPGMMEGPPMMETPGFVPAPTPFNPGAGTGQSGTQRMEVELLLESTVEIAP